MPLIRGIKIIHNELNLYPNSVPAIANTDELIFDKNVTFFVGKNGGEKTALLDMISSKLNLPRITFDQGKAVILL